MSHAFGPKRVLHDVNLQIARGEIVALVGPSGSGKSTLLRAILGTNPPQNGQILMNGKPVSAPGRDRGIVYQRYTLFPFMTALHNVAFGPKLEQSSLLERLLRTSGYRARRAQQLDESRDLLKKVGLERAMNLYPAELSGGMSQRVAIAQALIMKPGLLLLDEPFGALDESMREELQVMMLELYQENLRAKQAGQIPKYTILIVTHELNEAVYVADRVLGLSQYWRYEEHGHASSPGATIVYDAACPVFGPHDEVDFNQLRGQRKQIREVVMDPEPRRDPFEHVRFWDQVRRGEAAGVVAL